LGNISWIPKLLLESDIFINYSLHEGLCKAVLESMAVGVPVVASRVEGNIEVIGTNNDYGLLSNGKSEVELKNSIVSLVEDYNLYMNYAKKGIERVKDFDVYIQIKKIEKIYLNLSK